MARVEPLSEEEYAERMGGRGTVEGRLGFVARSLRTMARRPELARAYDQLMHAAHAPGTVSVELKSLISQICAYTSGCRHCQAHGAMTSERKGVDPKKEAALWEWERSPVFSAAERAALCVAQGAAHVPNLVTDEDFDELKRHFTDEQIVEIVGVIAASGFANRWNDTMATETEEPAIAAASRILGHTGWTPGKHAAAKRTRHAADSTP